MKTALPLLSFLFFAFTTKSFSPSGTALAAPDPVLDITGEKLRTGTEYYILPVIRGRGGGLTLVSRKANKGCSPVVAQEQDELRNGLPLTFSPVNIKKGIIRVSTDHNFNFSSALTLCVQSSVWKLDSYDESIGQWFVTTGGILGSPGRVTTGNWFKIEKYQDDYKLVFCPSVCNFCKVVCRDVGIFVDKGERRLALSDVPFKVMFKKA